MKIIDMHCDTLMMALEENATLYDNNNKHLSLLGMQQGEYLSQFFAIWMPDKAQMIYKGETLSDWAYIDLLRNFLLTEVEKHNNIIRMAYTYEELVTHEKDNIMSAILTLEDGRVLEGDMEDVKKLYDLGFRAIGLTWNFENAIGFPNSPDKDIMQKGLKPFGKELIPYLNNLGVLVDVSHLSDGGFWDVLELTNKPVIASHSNARALTNHPRNLTDDMIKALASQGGCTGINFAPIFMSERNDSLTKISDIIAHMQYIKNVGGIDVLAMGTDFDGVTGELEINRSEKMPLLFDAMKKAGFSGDDIEKVMKKNVIRVMKENL